MKTFILSLLGGLAALTIFFVMLPLILISSLMPADTRTRPDNAVLVLDLRTAMNDQPSADSLGSLFGGISFVEVLLRLNAAAEDDSIKGVYVRASEFDLGSSRAEELREAFRRLKAEGKFVLAHSQGFIGSGPAAYRAISAADEIWMQPGASFETPGIVFETLFLAGALDKLKVTPEILQLYEYKNAADVYKQTSYTPAHAEAMTELAQNVWAQSLEDIAADRSLDAAKARLALESSPHSAETAVSLGLIDTIGWPEDAADAARKRAGGDLIDIADYAPPADSGKAVIAIVGGEGDIVTGAAGGADLLSVGTPTFASDTVAGDILRLANDDEVDAIVFRIDSGGGSATASEQIWRAVERARENGKKVVVSMGAMAASGGYYVAAGADAIVANRSTITGSIGVFGGKFAIADGLRMIGVNPQEIRVGGEFASAYSTERLSAEQKEKMTASLTSVYERFTGLVAKGRNLTPEQVEALARGRVWSGQAAAERKLVDRTGDLIAAVETARDLAGFSVSDGVRIRFETHKASPAEILSEAFVAAPAARSSIAIDLLAPIVGAERAEVAARQIARLGRMEGTQLMAPAIVER